MLGFIGLDFCESFCVGSEFCGEDSSSADWEYVGDVRVKMRRRRRLNVLPKLR